MSLIFGESIRYKNKNLFLNNLAIDTRGLPEFQISLEKALEDLEWVDEAVVANSNDEGTSVYRLTLLKKKISDRYDEDELASCLKQQLNDFSISDLTSYEDEIIIEITLNL